MTSIPTQSFWSGKKVLVTGGSGLLGTALVELLKDNGAEVFAPTRQEVDWADWKQTQAYFDMFCPTDYPESSLACVFHLAARVGGVNANTQKVGDFFSDNIEINNNVLKAACCSNVERVVSVLSTCVYPDSDFVQYPLSEDQLHNGPPHVSNFGYAYAKRMLDVQSRALRTQYSHCNYITVIPNNLFGEHDNFNIEYGHVIPALIHKIWKAKLENKPDVEIWGDGTPLREFTYAKDAARIMIMLAETYNDPEAINIGCTQEHTIGTVATILAKKLGYHGELIFNTDKPSGQFRKPSTNKKLLERTVWDDDDYTAFDTALENTCEWFMATFPNIRS